MENNPTFTSHDPWLARIAQDCSSFLVFDLLEDAAEAKRESNLSTTASSLIDFTLCPPINISFMASKGTSYCRVRLEEMSDFHLFWIYQRQQIWRDSSSRQRKKKCHKAKDDAKPLWKMRKTLVFEIVLRFGHGYSPTGFDQSQAWLHE